jgi:acyl-homoserine lactone acylase PvdQ
MKYSEYSAIAQYRNEILDADIPLKDSTIDEALRVLREWDLNTDPDNKGAALAILSTKPYLKDYYEVISESELVDNFIKAAKLLKKKYGEIGVSWGKVNRMIRGNRNLSLGGGPDIMHSIYGNLKRNGELEAFAGDSYILFASWNKEGKVSSRSVHQYGAATMKKNSPHYSDQSLLFANRQLKDVWFEKTDILNNLESKYIPGEQYEK